MPRFPTWPTSNQGNIVGSRLSNVISHRFLGLMAGLSFTDQKDAALTELLSGTGEQFNVKSYGALGDGTTDDAPAVQTAVDAAELVEGTVVFPQSASPYLFASIVNTVSKVRIIGHGATIKRASGYEGNIFRLAAAATDVVFEGLEYDGNSSAFSSSVNASFIQVPSGSVRLRIRNCVFRDFADKILNGSGGLDYTHVTDNVFMNSKFRGWGSFAGQYCAIVGNICQNMNDSAIDVIDFDHGVISGNVCIADGTVEANSDGISINYGDNVVVTGNVIHGTKRGIVVRQGDSLRSAAERYTITGNYILGTSPDHAISLTPNVDDIAIVGNVCEGGIGITGDTRVLIANNQLEDEISINSSDVVSVRGNQCATIVIDTNAVAVGDIDIVGNMISAAGQTAGISNSNTSAGSLARLYCGDNRILGTPTSGFRLGTTTVFTKLSNNHNTGTTKYNQTGSPANLIVTEMAPSVVTLGNNATPSVLVGNVFKTGGTTTITDFDDGTINKTIRILSEHAITITDGTNILLNGSANFVMAAGDTLVLTMYNDQVWVEDSRQVN